MTSRLHDFNSELWQKWASMGVIFLACGAMLYQDRRPPPKRSCSAPVPSSHKKQSTSSRRTTTTTTTGPASLGRQHHHSRLPLAQHHISRLLLTLLTALIIFAGIFVYFKSHTNARDYTAHRYNMMPPS